MRVSSAMLYISDIQEVAGEQYQFKQAVQQDMMRVSSAMLYISDIQEVAEVSSTSSGKLSSRT